MLFSCFQINAEKAPYLTDKLKVWMLPTLALIKGEKVIDYVVGFDDMGGKDDFSTGEEGCTCGRTDLYNHQQGRGGGERLSWSVTQVYGQCGPRRGRDRIETRIDYVVGFDNLGARMVGTPASAAHWLCSNC